MKKTAHHKDYFRPGNLTGHRWNVPILTRRYIFSGVWWKNRCYFTGIWYSKRWIQYLPWKIQQLDSKFSWRSMVGNCTMCLLQVVAWPSIFCWNWQPYMGRWSNLTNIFNRVVTPNHRSEGRWLATPKRWIRIRGHDKPIHRSCAIYFPGGTDFVPQSDWAWFTWFTGEREREIDHRESSMVCDGSPTSANRFKSGDVNVGWKEGCMPNKWNIYIYSYII